MRAQRPDEQQARAQGDCDGTGGVCIFFLPKGGFAARAGSNPLLLQRLDLRLQGGASSAKGAAAQPFVELAGDVYMSDVSMLGEGDTNPAAAAAVAAGGRVLLTQSRGAGALLAGLQTSMCVHVVFAACMCCCRFLQPQNSGGRQNVAANHAPCAGCCRQNHGIGHACGRTHRLKDSLTSADSSGAIIRGFSAPSGRALQLGEDSSAVLDGVTVTGNTAPTGSKGQQGVVATLESGAVLVATDARIEGNGESGGRQAIESFAVVDDTAAVQVDGEPADVYNLDSEGVAASAAMPNDVRLLSTQDSWLRSTQQVRRT